jgi:CubicO group peptidase (beta-lactamase class C family)
VTWWTDSLGYCYPVIHVTARDAAWFGQMYLDEGMVRDDRVLSADWIHDSLELHSDKAWIAVPPQTHISRYWRELGYGYQWWSASVDGYRFDYAAGHGGQLIVLLDEFDMVIVVTADPYWLIHDGEAWKHEQACFNLVGKFIRSLPKE